jgi:hypothetical protein
VVVEEEEEEALVGARGREAVAAAGETWAEARFGFLRYQERIQFV